MGSTTVARSTASGRTARALLPRRSWRIDGDRYACLVLCTNTMLVLLAISGSISWDYFQSQDGVDVSCAFCEISRNVVHDPLSGMRSARVASPRRNALARDTTPSLELTVSCRHLCP